MLDSLVKDYLYSFNHKESIQREEGQFIIDYPINAYQISNNRGILFVKDFFLKNNYVFISKHPRFADYPEHRHEFLEFNYMLDGECTQIINGKEMKLSKGDLVLLNSKSRHKIKALSENDILINIIFPKEKFDLEWMSEINRQDNTLFSFLMQDITSHSEGEYVYFEGHKNDNIKINIEQMLNKYFTYGNFSNEMLRFYIPILFMELVGNTPYRISGKISNSITNEIIIKSLELIEDEYETLTLSSLSKKLSYSKNYLSNLLKEKTSFTFTELLNKERLRRACLLLNSTQIPIREISYSVGISNVNYFYKIFRDRYNLSPKEYRLKLEIGDKKNIL
ncbi:AraC family transcriptional regulator [Lactococcus sp.]|uniref:AraC family transcriptional regulator n=1 Tax=Lactococcus sp. TaxID=44273 RepID=UPI0035B1B026